jgi:hypothetical protein
MVKFPLREGAPDEGFIETANRKPHHNHPVILNLFQDLAHGKSHYLLNFIAASVNLYGEENFTEIVYFYRWPDAETSSA